MKRFGLHSFRLTRQKINYSTSTHWNQALGSSSTLQSGATVGLFPCHIKDKKSIGDEKSSQFTSDDQVTLGQLKYLYNKIDAKLESAVPMRAVSYFFGLEGTFFSLFYVTGDEGWIILGAFGLLFSPLLATAGACIVKNQQLMVQTADLRSKIDILRKKKEDSFITNINKHIY